MTGDLAFCRHGRQTCRALSALTEGHLDEALEALVEAERGWAAFGNPYERAQALFGQARCLLGLGRDDEVEGPSRRAEVLFGSLQAEPALRQVRAAGR
jgi:hypothetical protein